MLREVVPTTVKDPGPTVTVTVTVSPSERSNDSSTTISSGASNANAATQRWLSKLPGDMAHQDDLGGFGTVKSERATADNDWVSITERERKNRHCDERTRHAFGDDPLISTDPRNYFSWFVLKLIDQAGHEEQQGQD
ncbi:MAG: hypothetical protein ACI8V4_002026 [Ilumatobacter sp.]